MSKLSLSSNIGDLSGVGQTYKEKLSKLDISTVRDLIYHFPYRYLDFSQTYPISRIEPNRTYTISGLITQIETRRAKTNPKLKLTEAIIKGQTGNLKVVWFNQPYLENVLSSKKVILIGEVKRRNRQLSMANPKYKIKKATESTQIEPVYHQTKGVSSKWIKSKVEQVIKEVKIKDFLPNWVIESNDFYNLKTALSEIHFPSDFDRLSQAKRRLSFDELFIEILRADKARQKISKKKSPKIDFQQKTTKSLISKLSFSLTDDQKKAAWQIIKDLGKEKPMNRLLNGDVGSGKTIVATIAAFNTVLSGYQAAIMVPTEVLANQHYQKIKDQLKDFDIKVDIYTGSQKSIDLTKSDSGAQLVIGTHALIQDQVKLQNPGLLVVDEQQRFGVKQRQSLEQIGVNAKKIRPHFLTMTATPIPRTLSIAIYGDLNVSMIKEKPKERKPVITRLISPDNKDKSYNFIKKQLDLGHKAFVVCPLIEESTSNNKKNDKKSVLAEYHKLKQGKLANYKIDYLHGKMKSDQKQDKMNRFSEGKIDVLVSTSVIEIGVDIPSANVILIEGAERFGLSQLHQFRGRVGRSDTQSYCFLAPSNYSEEVSNRLRVITSTSDGFKVAREDLKLRGPGELLGVRQHGRFDLKLASFFNFKLVEKARGTVTRVLNESPDLKRYPQVKNELETINSKIHLE